MSPPSIEFVGSNTPELICLDLRPAFAPATHYAYEWQDYWLECPEADCLHTGTERISPVARQLFRLRFENQLGLTRVQAYAQGRPLGEPEYLEELSTNFPTPGEHLAFYGILLGDLFLRAARLPFTFSGPTSRGVVEALRPPTPLFVLHFLRQCYEHDPKLMDALTIIQAAPHRRLRDNPERVPLAEATEADADVLLSILQNPQDWVPAPGFPLAVALKGRAPARVWQRRPEETTDTPENRFILHFLRQVLVAAESLPAQPWWKNVPHDRQAIVREMASLLCQAVILAPFDAVGPMQRLPFSSQVLLRREGYRQMLDLWWLFQQARRPLFAPLQQAIEVRDIATLYEFWAFFALVEEIGVCLKESPVIDLHPSDEHGLDWRSEARFGNKGTLVYNRGFSRPTSYSLPLRPDFTWMVGGHPVVVLDAKFRLERADLEKEEDEDTPQATAKRADLYKMHTYRDALGVRAAVAVYPGDEAVFYDCAQGKRPGVALRELLLGGVSGIGALPMRPRRSLEVL